MEMIKEILSKITFLPNDEIKLAIIGGIVTVVFFLLGWAISSGSKMNCLRKKIMKLIVAVAGMKAIDESNVEKVYNSYILQLPKSVQKGWGNFLDQSKGYPSDYITAEEVLGSNKYKGKHTVGKVVYCVLSVIWWVVLAIVTVGVCKEDVQPTNIAVAFTSDFTLAASIICTVVVPIAVFVVFYFVLRAIYNRQRQRLELFFASMQDILDEKTLIEPKDPVEYDPTGLEEIARQVESLIAGRMEDGVIEPEEEETTEEQPEVMEEIPVVVEPVVEVQPEVEEVSAVVETAEEEQLEEEVPPVVDIAVEKQPPVADTAVVKQPAVGKLPTTVADEEEERFLAVLPVVVRQAVADPTTTKENLEELAEIIENALQNIFRGTADENILLECLYILADKFYE